MEIYQVLDNTNISLGLGGIFIFGSLLLIGKKIGPAVQLERYGLPIAVLSGLIVLAVGPFGLVHFLPLKATKLWSRFPTPLLALIFSSLMIGRPLPNLKEIIRPVFSQFLLGLSLGFGQFFFGGIVVLYFLSPQYNVDPLMGCLIEIGFEGGHGAAAIMGESFSQLGYEEGLDLGLAMATVGLLASSFVGGFLIIIGRLFNWIRTESASTLKIVEETDINESLYKSFRTLLINIGFASIAIFFGWILLSSLKLISPYLGDLVNDVINSLPIFPLVLIGSVLVRFFLEKLNKTDLISQIIQREIGVISTDLLIVSAMGSLDLSILIDNWIPVLILTISGLCCNLIGIALFSLFVFRETSFERSLVEFGNSTGVVASGLLLLRLADPRNITNVLPIFTAKQLFTQLILSGGLITILAPIAITKIGLDNWTKICGILTIFLIFLAVTVSRNLEDR